MPESSTTPDLLPDPHPGEILAQRLCSRSGSARTALACALNVRLRRINQLVHGKGAVSAPIFVSPAIAAVRERLHKFLMLG